MVVQHYISERLLLRPCLKGRHPCTLRAGGQVDGGNTSTVAWYAGETEVGTVYSSVITSYDYDAPIGESGAYGQPGIGGPNKFEVRAACSGTQRARAWATLPL